MLFRYLFIIEKVVLMAELDTFDLFKLFQCSGLLGECSNFLDLFLVQILVDLVHFLDVLVNLRLCVTRWLLVRQEFTDKWRDRAWALVTFCVVLVARTLKRLIWRRNVAAFPREDLARRHVWLIKVMIISRRRQILIEESRPEINCLFTGLDFLGLRWAQVLLKAILDYGIKSTHNFQLLQTVICWKITISW